LGIGIITLYSILLDRLAQYIGQYKIIK